MTQRKQSNSRRGSRSASNRNLTELDIHKALELSANAWKSDGVNDSWSPWAPIPLSPGDRVESITISDEKDFREVVKKAARKQTLRDRLYAIVDKIIDSGEVLDIDEYEQKDGAKNSLVVTWSKSRTHTLSEDIRNRFNNATYTSSDNTLGYTHPSFRV